MHSAIEGSHLRARPIVLSVTLFLLLALLVIVPAGPARAATFTVNSTADLVASGDASDGVCDVTCTLRAAVQEANGSEGGDVITLAATTYTLTIAGATEDAAATGDLDITEDVTINGAAGGTTIDADSIDRVFHVLGGATLTLNNVTITNGAADTGAGIQVETTGALDLDGATLTANAATGHGGAIYAAGDVTADLVTISGNDAGTTAGDGGGFYAAGGSHVLTSVTVADNHADNGGGLAHAAGTLTLDHTIVGTNTAPTGPQCVGTITSTGYNVITGTADCSFGSVTGDKTGMPAGIAGLADNGGPFLTHALNAGSNSLDVGGVGGVDCSATDQRGITRGAVCDAGALEAVQINFSAATSNHAESGNQALDVTLDGSDPNGPIAVTIDQTGGTAVPGTDYAFSSTPLSFPAGTTGPQSASVNITVDAVDEDDETAIFSLTSNSGALLGATSSHTLTIADNDMFGITLTPSSLTVDEGGSDTYDIVLDSEPTGLVTVVFGDGSEADAGPVSVTFTALDWDSAQTVVVSVADNAVADGVRADAISHTVTSGDGDYDGLDPSVPVTINDDDSASITVVESDASTDVAEATPTVGDTYTVTLGSAPVGSVIITPVFDVDNVTVTPATRTFTSADWDSTKTFTVRAVDDDVDETATHGSTITHTVTADSDPAFAAITPAAVVANIADNDMFGITLTPSSLTVDEGGSDTYDIVLDSEPTGLVTVVFGDGSEADAGPVSVTFTALDWDSAQTVVVSVADNAVADGVRADAISHTVTSGDGDYDGLDPSLPVTINDDEGAAEVFISNVTALETDGTTTFTFDVTVTPQSANPITVTYSTVPAGTDPADPAEYEAITAADLVIPALTGADSIDVEVYGDDFDESDERFRVNITAVAGGGIGDDIGVATITDDDDTPVADPDSYSVDEGGTRAPGAAGGVLAGDTDGDSPTLNAVLVAPPANHDGVFTLNPNGSFSYENNGVEGVDTFTYQASDGSNLSSIATVTITVDNVAPVVTINEDPGTSPEGTQIDLTSTLVDPGSETVGLTWEARKLGVLLHSASTPNFSFTPTDNGPYVVTLAADDGEGGTDSDSITINVTNVAPVVPAFSGDSIDEGDTFSLSASFTDVGAAETHTATVNWGDGTVEDCSVSLNCDLDQTDGLSGTVTGNHVYADDTGEPFTVTVTVSDNGGSDANTATVIVANVPPVFDTPPTDQVIFEGDAYTFAGAFSDAGSGIEESWSAEVNYQNGAGWQTLPLTGMNFTLDNTYPNDNPVPRTVTVCVADDDQLSTSPHDDGTCASASATVNNDAPVLTTRDDADVPENSTVELTGVPPTSLTDAGIFDTHSATVDWGEGAGPVVATVNGDGTIDAQNFYGDPGLYEVTVKVTDDDDPASFDTGTFFVNVQNLDFTVNVFGPAARNEGGGTKITGDFTDADGIGTYDIVVDWGDGSAPESVGYADTGPGTGTFGTGRHFFLDDGDCVAAPGSCGIVVTIDDLSSNDEGIGGHTLTVNNQPPATDIAGPTTSPEGTGFRLFGNPSDVAGDPLTYQWTVTKDTGGGPAVFKTGTSKNIWVVPDDGCATCVYEATYVVSDDDGGVTPDVWTIDVTNVAPDAQMLDEFGNSLPPIFDGGREGDTVSLQAVVTDPGKVDTHTYTWEAKLLDQVIDTGNQTTFDFVAPDDGTYFVVLTVTDNDLDSDTPGSPIITVSNAAPKITELVTNPTPSPGTPAALNVFFTEPGSGDVNTVTVNWGDGSPVDEVSDATSPAAFSHSFAAGSHRAKICVADDDGAKKCVKTWYNAGVAVSVAADFNGDGIEDMAVGVPGENRGAGAVHVLYGSASGPSVAGDDFFRQGSGGILGKSESGDEFGAVLAHGDFNGDGYDDLAIGAPGEALNAKNNAGSVNVLYGAGGGLTAAGDQLWTQDSNSVADVSEKGDRFGASLAVGDYNGDGFADLAIGVPGEDQSGKSNAGRVQVLFGAATKLVASSSQSWHQGSKGTLDGNQAGDSYGAALAAGDFDGDGFWELAIGVPGQKVSGKSKAGAVAILRGAVLGLTATGNQFWHQDKAGILEKAEGSDKYGGVLATGYINNDNIADLAIGIPLEGVSGHKDAGAVAVMYGTPSGLSAAGDDFWHEDSSGIVGAAAADDQFGFAIAIGDASGDGFDDLLVGIPNQAVGGDAGAGTVALIRGSASGLSAAADQRWNEDSAGILGKGQPNDHFGRAVAFLDVTGDGLGDLIAGIPGQDFAVSNAGSVLMVRGDASGGFTGAGDKLYKQDKNGMAGDGAQSGDEFGGAL